MKADKKEDLVISFTVPGCIIGGCCRCTLVEDLTFGLLVILERSEQSVREYSPLRPMTSKFQILADWSKLAKCFRAVIWVNFPCSRRESGR